LKGPQSDGLFAVVKDQTTEYLQADARRRTFADLDEQSSSGGTVVGTVKLDVAQRVVGLVVAGEDDDAVFFAGYFDDVVRIVWKTGGPCWAVKVSVSRLPWRLSAAKCCLMNSSAFRWPGDR